MIRVHDGALTPLYIDYKMDIYDDIDNDDSEEKDERQ